MKQVPSVAFNALNAAGSERASPLLWRAEDRLQRIKVMVLPGPISDQLGVRVNLSQYSQHRRVVVFD